MHPSSPPYVQKFLSVIEQLEKAKSPTPETQNLANSVIQTDDNLTCLSCAVTVRSLGDVRLLLQYGADPNKKNVHGLTSLHIIALDARKDMGGDGFKPGSKGHAITMLLLEHGADPDERCNDNVKATDYVNALNDAGKPNTEEYQDFQAIITQFQTQQLQKHEERKSSSDRSDDTALLTARSNSGDSFVDRVGGLRKRHTAGDTKEIDERTPLMASSHTPSQPSTLESILAAGAKLFGYSSSSQNKDSKGL